GSRDGWRARPQAAARDCAHPRRACWRRLRRLILRRPRCSHRFDVRPPALASPQRPTRLSLGRVLGVGATLGQLRQLDEEVAGRLGVEEYDPAVAVTDHRLLRLKVDAPATQFRHRRVDVLHLQADVEQALAALLYPFARAGARHIRLQQLEVRLADGKHCETGAVLGQMLLVLHLDPELVLEDVAHGLNAPHGNGDVLDTLDLHGRLLVFGGRMGITRGLGVLQTQLLACRWETHRAEAKRDGDSAEPDAE